MILLALILQLPPAPPFGEPWRPGTFRGFMPQDLQVFRPPAPPSRPRRAGEAVVEVVGTLLPESASSRTDLRLHLTAAARAAYAPAGTGSLEGTAMLSLLGSFTAQDIHGLSTSQVRVLQDLYNPPRWRPSWGSLFLSAGSERRR